MLYFIWGFDKKEKNNWNAIQAGFDSLGMYTTYSQTAVDTLFKLFNGDFKNGVGELIGGKFYKLGRRILEDDEKKTKERKNI